MFKTCVSVVAAMMLVAMAGCGGADLSSPKATAKSFAKAISAGDAATAKKCATGTPEQLEMVEIMANMIGAMGRLESACKSKFGDAAKKDLEMMSKGREEMDKVVAEVDAAELKTEGDTATLSVKSGRPMKFKKVSGDWKVDVAAMGIPGGSEAARMKKMVEAIDKVAADVKSGKHANMQAAQAAMMAAMMGG